MARDDFLDACDGLLQHIKEGVARLDGVEALAGGEQCVGRFIHLMDPGVDWGRKLLGKADLNFATPDEGVLIVDVVVGDAVGVVVCVSGSICCCCCGNKS